MKKLLALLMVLVMVFTLAACGKKTEEKVDKDEEETEEASETESTGETEESEDPTEETEEPTEETEEPTEEPTEPSGDLMDAPDVVYPDESDVIVISAYFAEDGEELYCDLGLQGLADGACYFAYTDEDLDVLVYANSTGDEIITYVYDEAQGFYVEDATFSVDDAASIIENVYNNIVMFTSPASLLTGAKYEKGETQNIEEFGEVVQYFAYLDGEVAYVLYVQVETGLTILITDAEDEVIAAVEYVDFEIDFAEYIA